VVRDVQQGSDGLLAKSADRKKWAEKVGSVLGLVLDWDLLGL
jgi:hypothetical protein